MVNFKGGGAIMNDNNIIKNNIKKKHLAEKMKAEIKQMEEDKYFEGIRVHGDPGGPYLIKWVKENAPEWNKKYSAKDLKKKVKGIRNVRKTIKPMMNRIVRLMTLVDAWEEIVEMDLEDLENSNGKNGGGK